MSYKSIIFFVILFGIILFGFFYYDIFIKYCPIHNIIKLFVFILCISSFFFPQVVKMFREGEDIDTIKDFIIEKYSPKK